MNSAAVIMGTLSFRALGANHARVGYDAPRPGHAERDIRPPGEMTMRTIPKALWLVVAVGAVVALTLTDAAHAQKKALIVALNQDPDILDPTLARTYVGRIIFAQMCEKLYDIDENLKIVPQLAADLPTFTDGGKTVTIKLRPGVKFNDGTPMNAEAVRFSLDRHLNLKGSDRLVFRVIADDNVRLANLRSGDIDFMHLVGPTDAVSLRKEGRFQVASVTGIGYSGMTINLHNKTGKVPQPPGNLGTPLAND